jgi:hypothetical protein
MKMDKQGLGRHSGQNLFAGEYAKKKDVLRIKSNIKVDGQGRKLSLLLVQ